MPRPPVPTVSTLSALLAGCVSVSAAAALHARLLKSSRLFRPVFLANCLAAAYSRLGAAPSAVAMLRHAPEANIFSRNILLSATLKSRDLLAARRLFDEMPDKDAVAYNSMMLGYIDGGRSVEALSLVPAMLEAGVRLSGFTFSIVLSAVRVGRHGLQVHAAAVRNHFTHQNSVVSNALINMYRRVGLMEHAVQVFWSMSGHDIVSWNSIMSVYRDDGQCNWVFDCFQLIRSHGFFVDDCSLSIVLSACIDADDFSKGDQLLAHCVKMGHLTNSLICSAAISLLCASDRLADAVWLFEGMATWDSETCNAMISGYARRGLMEQALGLFATALQNSVLPTGFTFASVLRWSSCFGLVEQGTQIHALIFKLGLEDDLIIATALVDMYCKLASLKHAKKIFKRVSVKDLVLWNTMIIGLSHNGRGKEALQVFRQMLNYNIQPDRITLSGVLSACSLEGLVKELIKIVLFENKYHIVPGVEHHTCVVDMLSRAGLLREAVDFVESKMQKCIVDALSNILGASLVKKDFGMAEIIAEKLMKLKPQSSLPYVVLARSYGTRCKWESMARMWRSMEHQGTKEVEECSWISIKNQIHVFTSVQILHHGREATYSMLDLLSWDMMQHRYVPRHVEFMYTQEEPSNSEISGCHQLFCDYSS
ncbi:pentatricopeptide repeat-containing protein At1g43980, mitochondrial-like [Oryza brachyantha]|uniref:Pentatricopeptide repeat-containing protein n=1 Tax=Oryza brachyantha TaxID=4533 RepID=J3LQ20_ORYBR|nr:pentatricopeptide repeat-containing protein At1g43980, mitochondrial-like [Oryza brachyantha]